KLVSDADSDRLLGAQPMCPHAFEITFGLTAAIASGMTAQALAFAVFSHPTRPSMKRPCIARRFYAKKMADCPYNAEAVCHFILLSLFQYCSQ
ncbi:MAG: hypothetical protein RR215_04500, partial [Ruthenibacterium sp.]